MTVTIPKETTHVLHWRPVHPGHGHWALLDARSWTADPAGRGCGVVAAARNAGLPELARLAGEQVGFPVELRQRVSEAGLPVAYPLSPVPLAAACERLFDPYPAAVTDLDDDGGSQLVLITGPDKTVRRLYRFSEDEENPAGPGTFYRIFRRGADTGLEIRLGGAVFPPGRDRDASAVLAAARVAYPSGSYTAPEVLAEDGRPGGWAEATANPRDIDWKARQARALYPFSLDPGGLPVNPEEVTGIREGRGGLGRFGENAAADMAVTVTYRGVRHVLLIERRDGHGWGFPGGGIDLHLGETGLEAAIRECLEESGLAVDPALAVAQEPQYVPDPRATDRAWAVTVLVTAHLGDVSVLPAVTGMDDAARAAWFPAGNSGETAAAVSRDHGGVIFPAHTTMIAGLLDGGSRQ